MFHSEHNRLVEHTKAVVLADSQAMLAGGSTQAEAVAFLNEWLTTDVATVPASEAGLIWDGERLFQTAKFGTEMQYQHLVFEEFARKIQPNINVFLVPDGYDVTIDPTIVAEFAHVVYRFGHSMLTESIDRFDPTFNENNIGLIEGFLNPLQFETNGTGETVDANISAGAIIRGMTRQLRQRDRRVRHERIAQQPSGPASRPGDDQSRARSRYRRSLAERSSEPILRGDQPGCVAQAV